MALNQTEQTEKWVLRKPNRPKYEFWPDRPQRNIDIDQTKQTKKWVLTSQNRPKYGYWTDRKSEKWVLA